MSSEIQPVDEKKMVSGEVMEKIILTGDISALNNKERALYYNALCSHLKLDPITKPFEIVKLQGKTVLYATKSCSEQLRKMNGVSITSMTTDFLNDICIVKVSGKDKTGREDMATGAVAITGLKGNDLANALLKCETKAKRRLTLSICGLSALDESELDTIAPEHIEPVRDVTPEPQSVEDIQASTARKKMIYADALECWENLNQHAQSYFTRVYESKDNILYTDEQYVKDVAVINKQRG